MPRLEIWWFLGFSSENKHILRVMDYQVDSCLNPTSLTYINLVDFPSKLQSSPLYNGDTSDDVRGLCEPQKDDVCHTPYLPRGQCLERLRKSTDPKLAACVPILSLPCWLSDPRQISFSHLYHRFLTGKMRYCS